MFLPEGVWMLMIVALALSMYLLLLYFFKDNMVDYRMVLLLIELGEIVLLYLWL